MKLFNIYIKKLPDQTIKDLIIIKNGFSFLAAIFNIFWFLQRKMWRESLVFILVSIIFGLIFRNIWLDIADLCMFGLMLMIGLNANYWYEQNLLSQNYQFFGCVYGKNEDEAKLKFFANQLCDENRDNIFRSFVSGVAKPKKTRLYFSITRLIQTYKTCLSNFGRS